MVGGAGGGGARQREPAHQRGREAGEAIPGDGGIYLYFLPTYSPELNEIEPVFRQVKYQEIPVRSHTTRAGLRAAVDGGFNSYRRSLMAQSERKPRLAA